MLLLLITVSALLEAAFLCRVLQGFLFFLLWGPQSDGFCLIFNLDDVWHCRSGLNLMSELLYLSPDFAVHLFVSSLGVW